MTTELETKLEKQLAKIDLRIEDAQDDLSCAVKQWGRRGSDALKECDNMLANLPFSLTLIDLAESDFKLVAYTKARMAHLIEQRQMLISLREPEKAE